VYRTIAGFLLRRFLLTTTVGRVHRLDFSPGAQFSTLAHPAPSLIVCASDGMSKVAVDSFVSRLPSAQLLQHAPEIHIAGVNGSSLLACRSYLQAMAAHGNVVGALYLGPDGTVLFHNTSLVGAVPTLVSMIVGTGIHAGDANVSRSALRTKVSLVPLTSEESAQFGAIDDMSAMMMGMYIALGYGSIAVVQAAAVVKEREVLRKQQQMMMGVLPVAYWAGTMMWDMALFTLPWLSTVGIAVGFGSSGFLALRSITAVVMLVGLFGMSSSLLAYVVSFCFASSVSVMRYLAGANTIATMLLVFTSVAIESPLLTGLVSASVPQTYRWVASVLPNYALARGMVLAAVSVCGKSVCVCVSSSSPLHRLWRLCLWAVSVGAAAVPSRVCEHRQRLQRQRVRGRRERHRPAAHGAPRLHPVLAHRARAAGVRRLARHRADPQRGAGGR
jgi:hypothetical protein